jgi:hypothetical protein
MRFELTSDSNTSADKPLTLLSCRPTVVRSHHRLHLRGLSHETTNIWWSLERHFYEPMQNKRRIKSESELHSVEPCVRVRQYAAKNMYIQCNCRVDIQLYRSGYIRTSVCRVPSCGRYRNWTDGQLSLWMPLDSQWFGQSCAVKCRTFRRFSEEWIKPNLIRDMRTTAWVNIMFGVTDALIALHSTRSVEFILIENWAWIAKVSKVGKWIFVE